MDMPDMSIQYAGRDLTGDDLSGIRKKKRKLSVQDDDDEFVSTKNLNSPAACLSRACEPGRLPTASVLAPASDR
ncbi:hypothetical protein E2553_42375 [Paraburkholderia dipogonis]|uniref:Uncharacterized protein n=1 Tax=Paraburkholderia dipogonis TaxID=1211383 RepID=A0A4Y8MGA6_9BURK|nr:hypothetical protein [Paraburkholderia dipogonis]TFE36414.1 hypothetical protein E2553_42375 [Paraburkholderia dipogonis]